ncbi:MAG TPA: dienelactone hydrolase family protein [Thermodesulfobacteriota bacterium]|nr:dienelactone hydrolase family protein [Thermodesulfobacteriota bacterium]
MKSLYWGLTFTVLVLGMVGVGLAEPKIIGTTVEYSAEGTVMKSYLAYDESVKGKRGGVLVVPEWWGLNGYARRRARMLAELGYTALAVDMYGEGMVVTTPDEAGKLSSETMKNFEVAKARFMAAVDFLKGQPTVDPNRVAAIGYCFGGGMVLNMARQGVDLKGVVSFHGSLTAVKPAQPGSVRAKILVLSGGADTFIPPDQVEAFKQEMKTAGASFQYISYPGALHSFTNPEATELGKKFNMPIAYNAKADEESWSEMKGFFNTILKG